MTVLSKVKNKAIYTPVFLYPIEVIEEEKKTELRVDHSRVSINPALSHLFELPPSFETDLLALLPTGEFNLATPGLVAHDLAAEIPNLDTSRFGAFPQLLTAKEARAISVRDEAFLLPLSAIVLVEKSKNVAGLLHELDDMLTQPVHNYPAALRALLGESLTIDHSPQSAPEKDFAPALLSPAQSLLLQSAASQPLTVCHGPPGTGKSFTISATALDQVARGNSILIACRSDEAAAVIESKISELISGSQLVVRAGRRQHLKKLKSLLDQLLATRPTQSPPSNHLEDELRKQDQRLLRLHKKFQNKVKDEQAAAPLFAQRPTAFWQKVRHWRHRHRIRSGTLLAGRIHEIISEQANKLRLLDGFTKQIHQAHLNKHLSLLQSRDTLKRYRAAIGRRIPASQERELLNLDLKALVKYLPIWVTTTDDIHRILPLKPGVFDLVIIDEATQCDLASALPILYRGRRALFTGDPQQLRHLSFLSQDRLTSLAQKHQLAPHLRDCYHFRNVSLLDRAIGITAGTDSLNFLDEHFRSLPPLIAFSNKHFYHGNLHSMREVEMLSQSKIEPAFLVTYSAGKRTQDGINQQEIDGVLEELRAMLACSPAAQPPTIGFLSPFRAQVDAFQQRLQQEFAPPDQRRLLHDHQLIAGTAHSFQGAERDIMLISLAIDPESLSAARRFLERPDVFNVSITRARHRIHLFSSVTPSSLPADSLLCQYLLHASEDNYRKHLTRTSTLLLPENLVEKLEANDWQLLAVDTEVAGMPIDLLLQKGKHLIAIDLIGTPDRMGSAVSVEKTLLLKRAGLPLYPLSIAEWKLRGEDFLAHIDAPTITH